MTNSLAHEQRPVRLAVVGCGQFGRQHLRLAAEILGIELVAAVDSDHACAAAAALRHHCRALHHVEQLGNSVEAAVVATPSATHRAIATQLLDAGIDVLVEKPLATTLADATALVEQARRHGRILMVGHVERFNPIVEALEVEITDPLFFEAHRLSTFSAHSSATDVVLDLMIHDIDLVLTLTRELPSEIRAAGIAVLSGLTDIATVRLSFPSGCVANLTASRVADHNTRRLRAFEPGKYVAINFRDKTGVRAVLSPSGSSVESEPIQAPDEEPLRRELIGFCNAVRTRVPSKTDGKASLEPLRVAFEILAAIQEHTDLVGRVRSGAAK